MDAVIALQALLQDVERTEGTGTVAASAVAHGQLGIAYFRLHDRERATSFTKKALALCEGSGDAQGVLAYRSNLAHILQSLE